mmetsp:Transcript_12084/g.24973  ORF Transcript_12084/g.24973 Transcript_12084/m.24973 type:complete len:257 (-) Transcript_12084:665-1435(-)
MESGLGHQIIKGWSNSQSSFCGFSPLIWCHIVKCLTLTHLFPILREFNLRWIGGKVGLHGQRLCQSEKIGRQPVNGEPSRNLQRKETNKERKKFQNTLSAFQGLLFFFCRILVDRRLQRVHGNGLQHNQDDGHDEECQGCFPTKRGRRQTFSGGHPSLGEPVQSIVIWGRHWSLEVRNPKEFFFQDTVRGEQTNTTIETQENGKLCQRRKATRQRILVSILIEFSEGFVLSVLVVLKLFLDFGNVRLQCFHILSTL